ncbi:HAD-IIA family hydrolase [Defluviimonas sp. SAOS-178_SWC]|uniref:HAD-IIA family hydrolase n=1 Tax=Defluviimonas sp. SAOS-178_SWC TaxID=3121287 RepID=UPI003221D741
MRTGTDAAAAFAAYEAVRHRLPGAAFPQAPREVETLVALSDEADAFLLDAFGVLNVGNRAIPRARETVDVLRRAGKRVIVVSNAASYCKRVLLDRYRRIGFDFTAEDVISSRDALLSALETQPRRRWGMMAPRAEGREGIEHLDAEFLEDDPDAYEAAEAFLLFGSGEWTEARQQLLLRSLERRPRPILVGNPDLVAPREHGLTHEPGYFAHRIADATGIEPEFFGKPFGNVFDLALSRLPGVRPRRIIMVGDTLQTDILGGAAAGLRTALVTGHGALLGLNPRTAMEASGIVPDFVMHAI